MSDAPKLTQEQAIEVLTAPGSLYATARRSIAGVEFSVFENAPRNLGELYALSCRHDDRTFLVYEDERYSYPEARQRMANLAHRLVQDYGVKRGDRVALAMRNYPEWCFGYMAVTAIGAVIVPLNAWWQASELRYGLEDSGARLLLADRERFDRLAPELRELGLPALVARPHAEGGGPLPEGAVDMGPLLEGEHRLPEQHAAVEPDDDASIMYTSGSTGHPKGVVSTHRAVVSAVFTWEFVMMARVLTELPAEVVERVRGWLSQGRDALSNSAFKMPQRTALNTLPLFHVTGCNVQFLPAFRNGRKIVMMHKWNPERALELIEREKVTDFGGVPTMSWDLVNSPDFAKRDTSSLQSLSAGGAARPPDQVGKLKQKVQQAAPSTGYGMTETNSLGSAIGGDDYLMRPASVGRALPPLVELEVLDESGGRLGVDQEGEIRIKSATNMRCYWNRPEATAETLDDGWIRTGDLGRIDAEGFLFITGRAKDIVIRGGENISCPEVEHALHEHPAVFEAAVYAVPDKRLGEAVGATVMLAPGAEVDAQSLQLHVAERLAKFKVPSHIEIQREPLPRIASGKFDKLTLKRAAAARLV
ncbi:MAG: acyl--CoA ligase [Myxococcales bacterium]|nr:acyl--CoA ligase [Myxococcales bacterium]